jgi:hypothetical protein
MLFRLFRTRACSFLPCFLSVPSLLDEEVAHQRSGLTSLRFFLALHLLLHRILFIARFTRGLLYRDRLGDKYNKTTLTKACK